VARHSAERAVNRERKEVAVKERWSARRSRLCTKEPLSGGSSSSAFDFATYVLPKQKSAGLIFL
jgi:hypothetical protein